MFAQIVSTKKPDGKTYKYLHIVESYREGGTVKKRRVASLGNISQYSEREIEQIIRTLESLLQHRTTGSIDDLETHRVLQFGVPYVVQFLWNQLGLSEAIRHALKDREVTFDVARYVQAMVIHRLVDPPASSVCFRPWMTCICRMQVLNRGSFGTFIGHWITSWTSNLSWSGRCTAG
ncbi:hypothetical protein [Kyrpidia spormannii]|uniref:hypothetical protein n=1 Tax=Kyrpidia spormannii TaxID=2055160 RepID=UPI001E5DAA59|nr:hypothetical protein [Kyrpidia spormannii]